MTYFCHPTSIIDSGAIIGDDTSIWLYSHICSGTKIGKKCNIGQSVFIDNNTNIGDHCKIQNNVNVYYGVTLEDYVFCGPSMTFTNVKIPRCLYPRDKEGPYYLPTHVSYGASLGAHSVVVCGIKIGRHAMIGSGSVVTKDVPDYALMVGNPARQIGWVCECGHRLNDRFICPDCGKVYNLNNDGVLEAKSE